MALAAIKGDRTLAELAEQFGPGSTASTTPAVDVKSLHAKIGELTLENDFLEGALSKLDGIRVPPPHFIEPSGCHCAEPCPQISSDP